MGRLLRSPDGHEGDPPAETLITETKTEETKTEETSPKEETKTEETKEETKTEETKEEVKVEPLTVESLTIPEGFELQPEMANQFLEILNGEQSPSDRANALIALHVKTMTEASEAGSKAWDDMQTEWRNEAKADPEIGGDKLQPALTSIGKLLDEFGSDDLPAVFATTGAGNNPHMIKFLAKISEKLTEGGYYKAASPGGSNDPNAGARRMYKSASDSNK